MSDKINHVTGKPQSNPERLPEPPSDRPSRFNGIKQFIEDVVDLFEAIEKAVRRIEVAAVHLVLAFMALIALLIFAAAKVWGMLR